MPINVTSNKMHRLELLIKEASKHYQQQQLILIRLPFNINKKKLFKDIIFFNTSYFNNYIPHNIPVTLFPTHNGPSPFLGKEAANH